VAIPHPFVIHLPTQQHPPSTSHYPSTISHWSLTAPPPRIGLSISWPLTAQSPSSTIHPLMSGRPQSSM
jgi:hypothetical protein